MHETSPRSLVVSHSTTMTSISQILSDDALRANYDASGKDSVESAPKVDPSTLFAMIFGSEKFVPLVGKY